jgi:Skp family chaperone for outer membrane proteins
MRKFGIPAAALAAALAVLAAAGPAQNSFKLGVVNLKTCFEKEKYERIKDVDADLQRMADDYAKRLKDIEKKMLELRDQIEALPRESGLRAQKKRSTAAPNTSTTTATARWRSTTTSAR